MLRYRLAAGALKAFSVNSSTRGLYRKLGNAVGGRGRRKGIKPGYVERADQNLRFLEQHDAIADGMRVMELGTGWVHWESLFTRLFYEVEVTLFDVWDNRQFEGFRTYAEALRTALPALASRSPAQRASATALLDAVIDCNGFEEVYALLGWRYVIDPDGRLDAIGSGALDLVYSSDVMEHIPEATLPRLAADLRRILKSGGHACQMIVEADHLCIYDRTAHPKTYLKFDDPTWKRWFENGVQYVNRWQHSDFVRLFEKEGFEIVAEEIAASTDTAGIAVAGRWRDYAKADLDATVTRLLVKMP